MARIDNGRETIGRRLRGAGGEEAQVEGSRERGNREEPRLDQGWTKAGPRLEGWRRRSRDRGMHLLVEEVVERGLDDSVRRRACISIKGRDPSALVRIQVVDEVLEACEHRGLGVVEGLGDGVLGREDGRGVLAQPELGERLEEEETVFGDSVGGGGGEGHKRSEVREEEGDVDRL